MLLFSFHIMLHALLTFFISVQCMAMSSFLLFHSPTAVRLPYVLLRFHFMAVLDARFYLMLLGSGNILEQSSVDPIQTCTHSSSSIKGRKSQPENSSLVLLVFYPINTI